MRALTKRGTPRRREYTANPVKRNMTPAQRIKHHTKTNRAGCWVWQLVLRNDGYGSLSIDGKVFKAHRVSYEAFVGPIPDGLHIDHLCRNRACVNPEHLEPVTCMVNVHRSPITYATRTTCPYGHPYDEGNTYHLGGRRYCLTCRRAYMRLYKQVPYAEAMRRKREGIPVVDLAAYFAEQEQAA